MSTQAQYASNPKNGFVTISTANTARDGTGTLGVAITAPANAGTRLDRLVIQAGGVTTANVIRLFVTKGQPGVTISSLTATGTTATISTSSAHGLTTGQFVTVQGAFPDDFNVSAIAVTVTSATMFTYSLGGTPALLTASSVGNYVSTTSTPVSRLIREILIPAVTPSTTLSAYAVQMSTSQGVDIGYMPIVLQPGYSLRVSTNNAETYYVTALNSGDLS